MCLFSYAKETQKLLKKPNKTGRRFYYKVVRIDGHLMVGPYRQSYTYKPGINKSDSKRRTVYKKDWLISKGIHVCRTVNAAKSLIAITNSERPGLILKVVKVTAYDKDLIGADTKYAVFKNVYLPSKKVIT